MRSVIAVLAAAALLWRFYPAQAFTDLLEEKPSPDGEIKAAYVMEHGPMTGTTYGITLSGKSDNPLAANPVLITSADDRPTRYRWASPNTLETQLPCGWRANLANHRQLPGTDRVIGFTFLPPQDRAGRRTTPSSSVPR